MVLYGNTASVSHSIFAALSNVFFFYFFLTFLLLGLKKASQCLGAWHYLAEAQMKIHKHRNAVLSCNQGNCLLIERASAVLHLFMQSSQCGLCTVGLCWQQPYSFAFRSLAACAGVSCCFWFMTAENHLVRLSLRKRGNIWLMRTRKLSRG